MNRLESKLKPLLRSFVENGPPGCALSVSSNGETIFEDYVGLADIETKKEIASDTIYRIYSMTKVVTCTAALMLYERGLFLLNDPLEEYLPEFKDSQVYRKNELGELYTSPAKRSITVKDLFTMTSGLTYPGEGNETEQQVGKAMQELGGKLTTRTIAKSLASIPLAFDPGTKWHYGLSHDVLGAFIEVLSGKTFGQFLQEEIFEPLHMKDTFFRIPEDKKDRLASNYTRDESGKLRKNTEMDSHIQADAKFESGGGGLLSTLGDYSRFAQMLACGGKLDRERIIGRKTVNLMATNHLTQENNDQYNWGYLSGYGYGLGVRTLVDPALGGINSSIGEFGWSGLLGTWVLIDPKENLSAVYMQQMLPNLEAYHQPRLRAVIYGEI
ncbi:serine hydrolase domain-containing protein [Lederbergia panacisoli]|uniref:serine hydrolase domain-containing protein n=1 Tax=Lederbergia panacisoli TaxID=1255251 RepID=UPI00214C2329|nr:serine hydrolase domain-containing protein [Lederbergia panacisoli]MCR2823645.1 beta-lactamase family protein [Lederbergia panacisoli]